jgi:hypothetical protein
MRSYPALETIAGLMKISTVIFGILGGYTSFAMMTQKSWIGTTNPLPGLMALIGTASLCLIMWAASEIILVFVNMGEDISKLAMPLENSSLESDQESGVCRDCGYYREEGKDSGKFVCNKWKANTDANHTCKEFIRKRKLGQRGYSKEDILKLSVAERGDSKEDIPKLKDEYPLRSHPND